MLRTAISGHGQTFALPDCPMTERACYEEGIWLTQTMVQRDETDMDDIASALEKIVSGAASVVRDS